MKIWLKQYTWQAASSINQQIGFSLWTWIERCPYFLGGQFIRASRDSSKIRRQETTFGKQQHSVPYPLKSRLLVTRLNIDMLVSKQHGSTSLGVNDGNEPIFWCLWWIYLWKVIGYGFRSGIYAAYNGYGYGTTSIFASQCLTAATFGGSTDYGWAR